MGVPARERVDHPVLDRIAAADFAPQRALPQLVPNQLGTVGSGNHDVDLMEDEEGLIWVGVHFGSRGFGHKTASGVLALAQGMPFGGRAPVSEMDSPASRWRAATSRRTAGLGRLLARRADWSCGDAEAPVAVECPIVVERAQPAHALGERRMGREEGRETLRCQGLTM
jgi:tRNA-splicing ligase RtcB